MLSSNPPSSPLLQSSFPSYSFIFTTNNYNYRKTHNKLQRVKLVGFPSVSSSTVDNCRRNSVDEFDSFPIEREEEKGLEHNENSYRLMAQNFTDIIKALPPKARPDILSNVEKNKRDWTISDFNDLLMALVAENELDIALKLYSDLSYHGLIPDSQTFSAMIRCHCKNNSLVEARQVLDNMVDNGFSPGVTLFTILINSLCINGKLQKAFEVFEVMGRIGSQPSIQTYNCLLKGLCYVGRVEEAFEMLMKMKKDSMEPDIYSYTVVMDGLCKVGRSNLAKRLLYEALERGLKPNVVTFSTLFNGYSKEGRARKGIGLLKLMKERNCVPDEIGYSTLLNGLLKGGEIGEALRICKEMIDLGFEIDDRMMRILLRGLCKNPLEQEQEENDLWEYAYQVFEKMKNKVSLMENGKYGMVIRALCIGKKGDEALVHLDHMIKMGHIPEKITFNNVIQVLCVEGKVEKALLVIFLMYEHNGIPSKTTYDALLKKLNQSETQTSAACIVYGCALKQGVLPRWKPRLEKCWSTSRNVEVFDI